MADSAQALPEPPYPPEIKARGWAFSLNVERIEASDTWALAGNELQPWLLKTWYSAWKSQPVGTMPAEPRLFAARIGMPWSKFQDAAEVLMRGWTLHSDGVMYHATITELVLDMTTRRAKDNARVKNHRARLLVSLSGNALQTGDEGVTGGDVTGDIPVITTPIPIPIPSPSLRSGESAPASPASPTAQQKAKGRKPKSEATTLTDYLSACKTASTKPVPEGHHVRTWAKDAGITAEMLQIAWVKFRERYTKGEKGSGKRYKDWPAHFATAVQDNWFKLWYADADGRMNWTSTGLTHKAVLDARQQQDECHG